MEMKLIASCLGLMVFEVDMLPSEKWIDTKFHICVDPYTKKVEYKGTKDECMEYFRNFADRVGEKMANIA